MKKVYNAPKSENVLFETLMDGYNPGTMSVIVGQSPVTGVYTE